MKKVLLVYYTQSGQLREIAEHFIAPFEEAGIRVEKVNILPVRDFEFPWTSARFFDAMPESVLGIPAEITPFQFRQVSYDLVIFAYQPWFLSPSIPATTALHDPQLKAVLKNTPVVTLIGARNMWLNAQEKVKKLLTEAGANLVGNVVLIDKNSNLVSVVTILYWMMTGKKDRFLNIFPKPGVSDADIAGTEKHGRIVLEKLESGQLNFLQQKLVENRALEVKYNLMFIEGKAGRIFSIWASAIKKRKNRKGWLVVFKYYLLFALFIVSPVLLLLNNVFIRPFSGNSIHKKKQHYLGLK